MEGTKLSEFSDVQEITFTEFGKLTFFNLLYCLLHTITLFSQQIWTSKIIKLHLDMRIFNVNNLYSAPICIVKMCEWGETAASD